MFDGNLEGLAQLGMMGKISTGSSVVDVLLCILLPAIVKMVTRCAFFHDDGVTHPVMEFLRDAGRGSTMCQRCISSEQTMHRYHCHWTNTSGTEGVHNHILQRALLLYINSLQDVAREFSSADLMLHAPVAEMDADDDKCEAERLSAYAVIASPPFGKWVTVSKCANGGVVEFMRTKQEVSEDSDKPVKTMTTNFHLRSRSRNSGAEELLSGFVGEAYRYYISKMERHREDCLYLYQPVYSAPPPSGDQTECPRAVLVYKRYALSGAKTFDDGFFHPEKASILTLVDSFVAKTGKFAVAGYPHKLGLLLHGPPGTGKTSLIKALAAYTKRHVVSIPLSRIETNQELMDTMYDHQYRVQGKDLPVRMPFSKKIFVMEDVDAACAIVSHRDEAEPYAMVQGPATKREADVVAALVEKLDKNVQSDRLNLAGLLNVLDGVLDCPERIVIMTTNHPEKLDPALVRPGRINRKVYMGYIGGVEALEMVRHYFGGVSEPEAGIVLASVSTRQITPATLEMLCGEHETVSGLCEHLRTVDPSHQPSRASVTLSCGRLMW
jgi:chaperone BCS1